MACGSAHHSVGAVAAKRMYCAGPGDNFAAMHHALAYQVFFSGFQPNATIIDNQGVAFLYYDHVFVIIMRVCCGRRGLTTRPER